jgi:hypothetical protein
MPSNKNLSRKALPPLVKVSFAPRLARPWISGVGESMWVWKITGTKMRGVGLLANQPYQLRYTRLGDLVLYATDRAHEKPEALAAEHPMFEHNFKAMFNGDQEAWADAASRSRAECKALLKRLDSVKCRKAMAKIDEFRQRILGCAICGMRDRWWMTTNEEWAVVPKRFRQKALCRRCFTVFATAGRSLRSNPNRKPKVWLSPTCYATQARDI